MREAKPAVGRRARVAEISETHRHTQRMRERDSKRLPGGCASATVLLPLTDTTATLLLPLPLGGGTTVTRIIAQVARQDLQAAVDFLR